MNVSASGESQAYNSNHPWEYHGARMKIVIVGAGGHGRVLLDILRHNHQFEIAGFLDSNTALHRKIMDGLEILGDISLIPRFAELGIGGAIIAIGDNRIRNAYAEAFDNAAVSLVSAIHPSANIAETAQIGKNVVIAAGANVCTLVKVEDSTILNTGCIIDHESVIHHAVHICPGVRIAGHVTVKPFAFVGIGATIIQGITIGQAAIIGAGAVVVRDVPDFSTVVGIPAHVIKRSPAMQDIDNMPPNHINQQQLRPNSIRQNHTRRRPAKL